MNDVTERIFAQFEIDGEPARPTGKFGEGGKGFGWGTVHHAAGSLRMPYRAHLEAPFAAGAVVDEENHGDGPGLHMILNHFVEDVQNHGTRNRQNFYYNFFSSRSRPQG